MAARPSLIRRAYDASYGRLFAAGYERMLAAAEETELGERRAEVVARATGRTLELGAGTGLNLPHYTDAVTELVLTEPFEPMARRLRARLAETGREAEVIEVPAEELPFDNNSFDTVVGTLVLCTVENQAAALTEVARVLKPGGSLHLLEHVRAQTPRLAKAQDVLHGPWFAIGHGCHCNRDTVAAVERSRLEFTDLTRHEVPKMAPIIKPAITATAQLP